MAIKRIKAVKMTNLLFSADTPQKIYRLKCSLQMHASLTENWICGRMFKKSPLHFGSVPGAGDLWILGVSFLGELCETNRQSPFPWRDIGTNSATKTKELNLYSFPFLHHSFMYLWSHSNFCWFFSSFSTLNGKYFLCEYKTSFPLFFQFSSG